MYMNPITKTILDNSFGEYRSILGSLIKAYVECQKKINSIIKRKNGNMDIDVQLCYLYSQAQNHLLMEILINHLIITNLHKINGGVLVLKGGKKTKAKKKGGGTSGKNKTRKLRLPIIKTTKMSNIILFFSLFLLLSLKIYSAKSDNQLSLMDHPSFKYKSGPIEIESNDDEHMRNYTQQFGIINERPHSKAIKSANLTELFSKESNSVFGSLFASFSSDKFNRDVIENTKSLMNNNILKVHSSLVKLCEQTFIEKSTDLSPIRLADLFIEINETEKNRRIEIQEELLDTIEQPNDSSILSSITNLLYSPAVSDDTKELVIGQQTEIKVQDIVEQANVEMDNMIKKSILESQYKQTALQNRKRYLENICEYSIQIPDINYNPLDGTITFTSFPYSREMVEVLIRNVIAYTKDHIKNASDEDGFKMEKQIELAKYLQVIFMTMDKTFYKSFTKGHIGRKSMDQFFTDVKDDLVAIEEKINIGLTGRPNEYIEAEQDRQSMIEKKNIENIAKEGRIIDKEIRDNIRDETIQDWRDAFNYGTSFATAPVLDVYFGVKDFTQSEIRDWVLFVLLYGCGGVLSGAFLLWMARKYTPWIVRSNTNSGTTYVQPQQVASQNNLLPPPPQQEDDKLVLRIKNKKPEQERLVLKIPRSAVEEFNKRKSLTNNL